MGLSWALGDVSVGLTLGPGRDTQREPLSWAASLGLNEAEKIPKDKYVPKSNTKRSPKTWSSLSIKGWFFRTIARN